MTIANPPAWYDEHCEWCRRGTEHNIPAHAAAIDAELYPRLPEPTPTEPAATYAPWDRLTTMAQAAADRLRARAAQDTTMGALLGETERRAVERYHVSIWEAEMTFANPEHGYHANLTDIAKMYLGPWENRGQR